MAKPRRAGLLNFDDVARKMVTPATPLSKENNKMATRSAVTPATPRQGILDLGVEACEVDGNGIFGRETDTSAPTFPLAICIAALKARASVSQEVG